MKSIEIYQMIQLKSGKGREFVTTQTLLFKGAISRLNLSLATM